MCRIHHMPLQLKTPSSLSQVSYSGKEYSSFDPVFKSNCLQRFGPIPLGIKLEFNTAHTKSIKEAHLFRVVHFEYVRFIQSNNGRPATLNWTQMLDIDCCSLLSTVKKTTILMSQQISLTFLVRYTMWLFSAQEDNICMLHIVRALAVI